MSAQAFRFDSFTFQSRLRAALGPRKPRHRVLRFVLGLVGLGLVLVLLAFSLVIGAVMIGGGLLYRLWKRRAKPLVAAPNVVEGEYRVVAPQALTQNR
ncbi:hypothetical protein [Lysobacter olei]